MNSEQQNYVLKDLLETLDSLYKVGNVNHATINIALSVGVKRAKQHIE